MKKLSAEEQKKLEVSNREHLKGILGGSLGLGAGTIAGYAGMKGIDTALRHGGGQGIPPESIAKWIIPLATGGMGMAMGSWQAHQQGMMNRGSQRT